MSRLPIAKIKKLIEAKALSFNYSDLQLSLAFTSNTKKMYMGDYTYLKKFHDGSFALLLADFSGNAPQLETQMAALDNWIESKIMPYSRPNAVLKELNLFLGDILSYGSFASCWLGYVSAKRPGQLMYASAGAPPSILLTGKEVLIGAVRSDILGIYKDISLENVCIDIDANDRLFLFTDALTETPLRDNSLITYELISCFLKEISHETLQTQINRLLLYIEQNKSSKVTDDLTLLLCQF